MSKIVEKILEPSIVYTGSSFKLKVKIDVTQYHLYSDYFNKYYSQLLDKTYLELKEG